MQARGTLVLILALGLALLAWFLQGDEPSGTPDLAEPSRDGAGVQQPATLAGRAGESAAGVAARASADNAADEGDAGMPAELQGPSLRGRVVDRSGAGVPGVGLTASFRATHLRDGSTMRAGWKQRPPRSRALVTDANGAFAMAAKYATGSIVRIDFTEVPRGFLQPAARRFAFRDECLELVLEAGVSLAGQVVSHPELGAAQASLVSAHWLEGDARHERSLKTGQDGQFEFFGLPPGARLDLVATPAFEKKAVTFQIRGEAVTVGPKRLNYRIDAVGVAHGIEAGRQDVEIVLGAGGAGAVEILALDAQGTPLAGCQLDLEPVAPVAMPIPQAVAGPDGRVVVRGLPAGIYRVRPRAARGKPPWVEQTIQVPSERVRLAFVPAVAHRIRGQLVGAGTISGFHIVLTERAKPAVTMALTDGEGRFAFTTFSDPLDLRAERFGDPRFALLLGFVPGEEEAQMVLEGGTSIEGRVMDVNGHPLRGEGWVVASNGKISLRAALPDGGRFRFTGLPPGRYTLRAGGHDTPIPATREGIEGGAVGVILTIPEQR